MIQLRNIRKRFGKLEVLKGIDLDIDAGEVVSIVGPSGAGKTTLLQIMGTLDKADEGTVIIDGTDVTRLSQNSLARFRGEQVGFVFQFHQLLSEFTALENVMMPALIAGRGHREARERAEELLSFMGLSERASHKPAELSGGEKQRIAVARALINKPSVVLADEPSGSLDSANKAELHRLFFDLRDQLGQTFVIVTHDEDLAAQTDRTIQLRDGQVVNPDELKASLKLEEGAGDVSLNSEEGVNAPGQTSLEPEEGIKESEIFTRVASKGSAADCGFPAADTILPDIAPEPEPAPFSPTQSPKNHIA